MLIGNVSVRPIGDVSFRLIGDVSVRPLGNVSIRLKVFFFSQTYYLCFS